MLQSNSVGLTWPAPWTDKALEMLHLHTGSRRASLGFALTALLQCVLTWWAWGSLRAAGVDQAASLSAGLLAGFALAVALPWWATLAVSLGAVAVGGAFGAGLASAALSRLSFVAIATGEDGVQVRRAQGWLSAGFVAGLALAASVRQPSPWVVVGGVAAVLPLRPWLALQRSMPPRNTADEPPAELTAIALADEALFAALVAAVAAGGTLPGPALGVGAIVSWAIAPLALRGRLGTGAAVVLGVAGAAVGGPAGAALTGAGLVAARRRVSSAPAKLVYSGRPRVGLTADRVAVAGAGLALVATGLAAAFGLALSWVAAAMGVLGAAALAAIPPASLERGPGWISQDQARNGAAVRAT